MQPDRTRRKKDLFFSSFGAMVICFIASLTSDIMYFFNISYTANVNGQKVLIGVNNYVEHSIVVPGIYSDTNHAATYAIISALFSLALFLECKRGLYQSKKGIKAGKALALANIAIQAIYFTIANSRGGWVSLFVAVTVTVFILLNKKSNEKNSAARMTKVVFCSLAAALFCCAILFGVRACASAVFQQINNLGTDKNGEEIVYDFKKDDGDNGDFGSGRVGIWKDAFRLYTKRPLLGVGAGNSEYYAQQYFDSNRLGNGKAIHNSYIDLLVDYGIIGFILLMAFFLTCAVRINKWILLTSQECDDMFFPLLCGAIMIACSSFFLSCIFINCTAMYYFLMIILGYLEALTVDEKTFS